VDSPHEVYSFKVDANDTFCNLFCVKFCDLSKFHGLDHSNAGFSLFAL
jgi:hypothetical protein